MKLLWIFYLLLVYTESYLYLRRYLGANCTNEPFFELVLNWTFPSFDEEEVFCSRNFPDTYYPLTVGFSFRKYLNLTFVDVTQYWLWDCDDDFAEFMFSVQADRCEMDLLWLTEETHEVHFIFSEVEEIPPLASFTMNNNLENEYEMVRTDHFIDDHCVNKSADGITYDHSLISINDKSNVMFPYGDGLRYLVYSTYKNRKRCNETYLIQDFSNEVTLALEEYSIFRLDVLDCFSVIIGTVAGNSYRYTCVDTYFENDIPAQLPKYQVDTNYWNQICFGSPYRMVEFEQGLCNCIDYTYFFGSYFCTIEYFYEGQKFAIFQYPVDEPICFYPDDSTEHDEMRIYIYVVKGSECLANLEEESSITNCGFGSSSESSSSTEDLSCYILFENSDERVADTSKGEGYVIMLLHNESCSYYEDDEHHEEWGQVRKELKTDDSPYTFYFHSSMCISDVTIGVHTFYDSSMTARCKSDGELEVTYFTNSILCDENRPFDDEYPVFQTLITGDYCINPFELYGYDDIEFYTFTCSSIYCGDFPQFDTDNVCSGNGVCVSPDDESTNEGICICSEPYTGQFCGQEEPQEDGLDDLTTEEGLSSSSVIIITTLSTIVPILLIILISCLCGCACLVIFMGLICLFFVCSCPIFFIFSCLTIQQKRSLKKYGKLKHFDILLKEQELENDSTVAKLKIDKSLFEIPFEEIKIVSVLGSGGSEATVYLSKWGTMDVAFKCFKTRDICTTQDRFDEFELEVSLLSSLAHPNIIRFFGASLKPPRVGIVMEYCSNGEILDFFIRYRIGKREEGGGVRCGYPTDEKLRMASEIISSLEYCHSRNLIHRDLKVENILVDEKEHAKLMDFGLSKLVNKSDSGSGNKTKKIGTFSYMAPEILFGDADYDEKVDCFSFAILLFVIFTENPMPYGVAREVSLDLKVANDEHFRPDIRQIRKAFYLGIGGDENTNILMTSNNEEDTAKMDRVINTCRWIEDIIQTCWKADPSKRYSFAQLSKIFEEQILGFNPSVKASKSSSTVKLIRNLLPVERKVKSMNALEVSKRKKEEEIYSLEEEGEEEGTKLNEEEEEKIELLAKKMKEVVVEKEVGKRNLKRIVDTVIRVFSEDEEKE